MKVILLSAAAKLGSANGMCNLGTDLITGRGIEKNEKLGFNYLLKSLEKGFLDKYTKKNVDIYYYISEGFRRQYPNYQIWN